MALFQHNILSVSCRGRAIPVIIIIIVVVVAIFVVIVIVVVAIFVVIVVVVIVVDRLFPVGIFELRVPPQQIHLDSLQVVHHDYLKEISHLSKL